MKLNKFFTFFVLGVFLLNPVFAQEQSTSFGEDDLLDVNKITTIANPENWKNISQVWKQNILSNQVVSSINLFFTEINFVFLILFGEPYSFSLIMLFIFVLWLFFLFQFKRVLQFSLISSKAASFVISAGLTIILAQIGLYRAIAGFLVNLIFLPKQAWLGIAIFIGELFLLVILGSISKIVEKVIKKSRFGSEEEKAKINRNILEKFAEQLKKGAGK